MLNQPENSFREVKSRDEDLKKDRSLYYMGLILGFIILAMTYMTLFTDDPWLFFRSKEKTELFAKDKSAALDELNSMTDQEVRQSLVEFIQAFYYDQQKGYFDPPSYFAPITKTFYNFHNLTYNRLRDIYWNRMESIKNLDRNWLVSSLEFSRTDSGIVATYWAIEKYFNPSVNQQQSIDRKYEMIIDEGGKIYSLKDIESRNFESYTVALDSALIFRANPVATEPVDNPLPKDHKIYDVSMVETAPEYKGGQLEFSKYLLANMRYPPAARENKVQGKVYVAFIVDKEGFVKNVAVRQGLGSGCDEEAIRLVRSSPPWSVGKVAGNSVDTYFVIPVTFQLD
jgi:TonB family protein